MKEVNQWMLSMWGASWSDNTPFEMLLKPQFERFIMHIIKNTRPSNVATNIQRNFLIRKLKEDFPRSQFPLKVHMDCVEDLLRFQLVKENKVTLSIRQPILNMRTIDAFQGSKVSGKEQAASQISEHFKLMEYYSNKTIAAKQFASCCHAASSKLKLGVENLQNRLEKVTNGEKLNPNYPPTSSVWKSINYAMMLKIVADIKELKKRWKTSKCSRFVDLVTALFAFLELDTKDPEFIEASNKYELFDEEIVGEPLMEAEKDLSIELLLTKEKETVLSLEHLMLLVLEEQKTASCDFSIETFEKNLKKLDSLKTLQLHLNTKIQNLFTLFNEEPYINQIERRKNFEATASFQKALDILLNDAASDEESSFLYEESFNETLNASVLRSHCNVPLDALIEGIKETNESLVEAANNLSLNRDLRLIFFIECLEECRSKKVGKSTLSELVKEFLFNLENV